MINIAPVTVLVVMFCITFSWASEMVITATQVTFEKEKNQCIAEGQVKVVQKGKEGQEITHTLTADRLTVLFEKSSENTPEKKSDTTKAPTAKVSEMESSAIKKIQAEGHVCVEHGTIKIFSKTARYTALSNEIEFFDHVKIHDPQRAYIESAYAVMNRKTGTYVVSTGQTSSPTVSFEKDNSQKPQDIKKVQIILKHKTQ